MTVLLEGNLAHVSLFNLLQFVRLEQKDCKFVVEIKEISQSAELYFQRGTLIYASLNKLKGPDAMYRLICWWDTGHFEMMGCSPEQLPAANIEAPLDGILMESARYMDEQTTPLRKILPKLTSGMTFTDQALDMIREERLPEFTKNLPKTFSVAKYFDVVPYNQWDSCKFLHEMLNAGALMTADPSDSPEDAGGLTPIDSLESILMEFTGVVQSRDIMDQALQDLDYERAQEWGFTQLLSVADKLIEALNEILTNDDEIQEAMYRLRARITSLV